MTKGEGKMYTEKSYYVYIIASSSGTLYIGITNNLMRRIYEHKNGLIEGFSKKYSCHKLIYYEIYGDVNLAIAREKQLKGWRREKKENIIKKFNPHWKDLYDEMF
jgi:putative endonuclease